MEDADNQLGLFGEPAPKAATPDSSRPAAAKRAAPARVKTVDPARCRLWAYHNRRYDLLNSDNCQDLLDSLRAQRKQEFPAIVRRLKNDPQHDWEVLCGARRLWSVRYLRANGLPDFPFLIEERTLSDEEGFCLADAENRERRDISDYERARDYRRALDAFFPTQADMAARLKVSPAWLSRYLDLAALPEAVLAAYPDVLEIKVEHARSLKPLLQHGPLRERLLARAAELAGARSQAAAEGEPQSAPPTALEVTRALRQAAQTENRPKNTRIAEFRTPEGRRFLSAERKGRGQLQLNVSLNAGMSVAQLLEACERALGLALEPPP